MNLIKTLFELSLEKEIKTRLIFWGIVVVINASIGFILASNLDGYSTISMIIGICFWGCLYSIFGTKFYQKIGESGYKKLQYAFFSSYLLKTLHSIFGAIGLTIIFSLGIDVNYNTITELISSIFIIPDFSIGMLSAAFGSIIGLEGFIEHRFFGDLERGITTFFMTIIHGGILSLITIILGLLLYPIVSLYFRKTNSNTDK